MVNKTNVAMYIETCREDELDEIFYPTKEKCILSLFDK